MTTASDHPRTRALNRAAGTTALVVGGLAALATVMHLAQTVWIIAQGRVGTASVEVVDGGVMVTSRLNPGDVSVEAVIAALVGDVTILIVIGVVSAIAIALVRDRPFGRRTPLAVAVAGLAVVFARGAELQRATEGLV